MTSFDAEFDTASNEPYSKSVRALFPPLERFEASWNTQKVFFQISDQLWNDSRLWRLWKSFHFDLIRRRIWWCIECAHLQVDTIIRAAARAFWSKLKYAKKCFLQFLTNFEMIHVYGDVNIFHNLTPSDIKFDSASNERIHKSTRAFVWLLERFEARSRWQIFESAGDICGRFPDFQHSSDKAFHLQ